MNNDRREALRSVNEFSKAAPPAAVRAVERYLAENKGKLVSNPKAIIALTQLKDWVGAMSNPKTLTEPVTPDWTAKSKDAIDLPTSLLRSLAVEERQEIFVGLVEGAMPERVRKAPRAIADYDPDPAKPFNFLKGASGKTIPVAAPGVINIGAEIDPATGDPKWKELKRGESFSDDTVDVSRSPDGTPDELTVTPKKPGRREMLINGARKPITVHPFEVAEGTYVRYTVAPGAAVQLDGTNLPADAGAVLENANIRIVRMEGGDILLQAKKPKQELKGLVIGGVPRTIDVPQIDRTIGEKESTTLPGPGNEIDPETKKPADSVQLTLQDGATWTVYVGKPSSPELVTRLGAELRVSRNASGNIEIRADRVDKDADFHVKVGSKSCRLRVMDRHPNLPVGSRFNNPSTTPEGARQLRIAELVYGTKRPGDFPSTGATAIKPDELQENIAAARASLEQMYMTTEANRGAGGDSADSSRFFTNKLIQDYKDAVRVLGPVPVGETQNPAFIAARIPKGPFCGALNLGIIDGKTLSALGDKLPELQRDREGVSQSITRSRDALTKETKRLSAAEATTIRDVWDNLGGMEKMVLIAALGYGAYRYRGMAMIAGGVYFGMKFIGKDESPLDTIDKLVGGGIKKARDLNQSMFGFGGTKQPQDALVRARAIVNFLPEADKARMETEGLGLALLSDMPMRDLANNFVIDGAGYRLDAQEGGNLMRGLSRKLQENNLSTGALNFFRPPNGKNVAMAGDAMANVFYTVAVRKNPTDDRAIMVREAMSRLPAKSRFEDLRTQNPTAYQAYVDLMTAGRAAALAQPESLGDFLRRAAGLDSTPPPENADERRKARIEQTRQALAARGKDMKLDSELRGGRMVVFSLQGTEKVYEADFSQEAFETKDGERIVREWMEKMVVMLQGKMDILHAATPGPRYGMELKGDNLEYHYRLGPLGSPPDKKWVAITPIKDLVDKTPAQIDALFADWVATPITLTDDPVEHVRQINTEELENAGKLRHLEVKEKNGDYVVRGIIGASVAGAPTAAGVETTVTKARLETIGSHTEIYKEWKKKAAAEMQKLVNADPATTPAELKLELVGNTVKYNYVKNKLGILPLPLLEAVTDFDVLMNNPPAFVFDRFQKWHDKPVKTGVDAINE